MLKPYVCYFAVCLSLSLTFISCDDEDPDNEKPSLTLEIVRNGIVIDPSGPVRGTVTFKVNATDNLKTAHIQLLVDDQVVNGRSGSDLLEVSFDTRTLSDGVHSIKAMASDEAGNTSENTFEVGIQNVLYRYAFPKNYNSNSWLVLSDNIGFVHDYRRNNNGETITFLYPQEYTDQAFDLTTIDKGDYAYYRTVTQVPPGDYFFANTVETAVGIHTLNIPNPQEYTILIYDLQNWTYNTTTSDDKTKYEFSLSKPVSNLYLIVKKASSGEERYYYNPSISAGGSTTLDETLWNQMKPLTKHVIPSFTNSDYVLVFGILPDGREMFCSVADSNGPSVSIGYPHELLGPVFTAFVTSVLSYSSQGDFFVTDGFGKKTVGFLTEIEKFEGNLTSLTKKQYPVLQLTTSGTADYASYRIGSKDGSLPSISWDIYGPFSPAIKVQLPVFTNELLSAIGMTSLPALDVKAINFYEYGSVEGYEPLVGNLMTGFPDGFFGDGFIKNFYPKEISGGRSMSRQQMFDNTFTRQRRRIPFSNAQ